MKIEITTDHSASKYGVPVCLIDEQLVDDATGIKASMKALRWRIADASQHTGKTVAAITSYRVGQNPVPAEVWNVLQQHLEKTPPVSTPKPQ